MLHVLGEVFYISGIILNLWAYLSPTAWTSNNPDHSVLKFTPYNEPVGHGPANPCGSSPLSPKTISIRHEGSSNAANYSNVAVWMGPLGSCSRDQDGAVHCTKPSYSNPQYNMTYVQSNSVYFPNNMNYNLGGVIIRGFTFLHCIMFGLYLLVSVSYWSPVTASRLFGATSSNAPAAVMLMLLFLVHILAACVEFFFNFSIRPYNLNTFNSIDNFYDPAPCGQSRPLKSGILLKAQIGKMYQVTWVAWCLIYLIANMILLWRWGWVIMNYERMVKDASEKRAAGDVERTAAKERKEPDEFRSKVEKEKEFTARCDASSSCDDFVPPYPLPE